MTRVKRKPVDENDFNVERVTDRNNQKLTDAIFNNELILEQLEASSLESDDDLITSKEEFMRTINEVRNAAK